MPSPIRALLDRCKVGFTAQQKALITILCVLYVCSPLDLIPLWFLPIDDIGALVLMFKVLTSPTLPPARGTVTTHSTSTQGHESEGAVRRSA